MRFLGLASTLLLLLLFTSLSHCQDNDEDFGSDDEMALSDDAAEMEESDGKEMNETKPAEPAKPEKKEEEKEENKGEKEESKEENKEDKKEDNKEASKEDNKEKKEEVESVDGKKCPFVCTRRKLLKKSAGSSGAKIIILTSAGRGRHRSFRNHFLHRGGPSGMRGFRRFGYGGRFGYGPFNRFRGPFRGPFRFRHHHRRVFPEAEELEELENESVEEKPTATAEEDGIEDDIHDEVQDEDQLDENQDEDQVDDHLSTGKKWIRRLSKKRDNLFMCVRKCDEIKG